MVNKLRALLKRPLYRYVLVGGSVYVFEVVVIIAAQRMGASALVSVALGFLLGLIVSFWLQKLVAFRDHRLHHRILLPQFMAVTLLVVWNLSFTLLLTKLLQRWLPAVVIRTIALGITTLWNFYLYKTRIFKAPDEPLTY
jgi:putative flippase GtrA